MKQLKNDTYLHTEEIINETKERLNLHEIMIFPEDIECFAVKKILIIFKEMIIPKFEIKTIIRTEGHLYIVTSIYLITICADKERRDQLFDELFKFFKYA